MAADEHPHPATNVRLFPRIVRLCSGHLSCPFREFPPLHSLPREGGGGGGDDTLAGDIPKCVSFACRKTSEEANFVPQIFLQRVPSSKVRTYISHPMANLARKHFCTNNQDSPGAFERTHELDQFLRQPVQQGKPSRTASIK